MKVLEYTDDLKQEWDDFVLNAPDGTLFHLTTWKRVLEQSFGYPSIYLCVKWNQRIQGILPLFSVKNLLGRKVLISVPFGVTGGIVASDSESASQLLFEATKRAQVGNAHYLELRHQTANGFDLPVKDLYVTFKRQILPTDEENLQAIPRKQRRMIRQGMQSHLESRIGGIEDLRSFYHVYATNVRNLGTPVFPYSYFETLLKEFGEACRILSVSRHGQVVAAVMTFFYKDQVLPYYGGGLPEFRQYAVYDFMYWELMRYARKQGYKIFDFGRSKRDTGAYHFKRHWGFEPTPLPYQYYLPKNGALPDLNPLNPKLQIFIGLWKRCPLPVANFLGPKIVKYLP